jgi:hypothetical protein
MGSTIFGNVYPAMTGHALPAKFTDDRTGVRRVRGDGRA